jgi:hypothetical protein
MIGTRRVGAFLVAALGLAGGLAAGQDPGPKAVSIGSRDGGGAVLVRGGTPYFVKGAGGDGSLALLAECGGNSVRTWGAERLGRTLDEARERGLTVCAGIWLGHEDHGFRYDDPQQVARQKAMAREVILKYRDHPALLVWGIGNEMEGDGRDPAVWAAVEEIAALAKELDPNHPTMTVIAELGEGGLKVKELHRLCPHIEIVGINSYGGAPSVPERYRRAGGTKPYLLTEFGPPGQWELEKTPWGAAPELTSTEKAAIYRRDYRAAVEGVPECLGSYAFLWGHKQEATATWFGLLLPDGSKVGGVDALTELWSGQPPANRCPTATPIALRGDARVKPGAAVQASWKAADPDGDPLKVEWVLQAEGTYGSGGATEATPTTFAEAIRRSDPEGVTLTMPEGGGGYRLFAYARDGRGGAATASLPLHVDAPSRRPASPRARLPLAVYDEAGSPPTYVPTGWMGNTSAIALEPDCEDNPHSGRTCLKVEYRAAGDWGGVVWQSPADDWGDRPGGYDLDGAARLSFRARGERGGEVVSFEFGLYDRDKKFYDTAMGKLERVTLGKGWTRHEIDLADKDLSRIKSGFCWTVAGPGEPVTFYLDDIRYEE